MTSLDSSSQASDSRPPTPPSLKLIEDSLQKKRENHNDFPTVRQNKFKKSKTDRN